MKATHIYTKLLSDLNPENLFSPDIQSQMRKLPLAMRENLAFQTHTMVVYYDEEVTNVRQAEELAALRAAPAGYKLAELNGVNVGCGDRTINEYLIGTDVHNGVWEINGNQNQQYTAHPLIRCWADDLPFKSNSIDYLVALHILEHIPDPVKTVFDWLDMVKPGGGVGIIVPDWRYTWDARNDQNIWSHRWNPTPNLIKKLYDENWSKVSQLEHFCTYKWKLSFDFVLRKFGEFRPFNVKEAENILTGRQLADRGLIYHSDE